MIIPASIHELINTASLYSLIPVEIACLMSEYAKAHNLTINESERSISLFKKGVEPHKDGYEFCEKLILNYNIKNKQFSCAPHVINLN